MNTCEKCYHAHSGECPPLPVWGAPKNGDTWAASLAADVATIAARLA